MNVSFSSVFLELFRDLICYREENGEENNIDAANSPLNDDVDDEPGAWEEDFKSHPDSKPNGPEAIALDFSFPQSAILFGMIHSIGFEVIFPSSLQLYSFSLKRYSRARRFICFEIDIGQ